MDQARSTMDPGLVVQLRRDSTDAAVDEAFLAPIRAELLVHAKQTLLEGARRDDAFVAEVADALYPLVRLHVLGRLRMEIAEGLDDGDLLPRIADDPAFRDRVHGLIVREFWESPDLVESFGSTVMDRLRREVATQIREDADLMGRIRDEILEEVTASIAPAGAPPRSRSKGRRRALKAFAAVVFLAGALAGGYALRPLIETLW